MIVEHTAVKDRNEKYFKVSYVVIKPNEQKVDYLHLTRFLYRKKVS